VRRPRTVARIVVVQFCVALLVDGMFVGTVYALIALAFIVVYKTSRTMNFALGEWLMLGAALVAAGMHGFSAGLAAAIGAACVGMTGLALAFNGVVLARLVGQRPISMIMITLGLGALMRGFAAIAFSGAPTRIALPIPSDPLRVHGLSISADRLVAAVVATISIGLLTWLFQRTRTGVALRAIADDQQVAMAMGIDVRRYFAVTWGVVGVLSVLAGVLWTSVSGGGFGVVLVGLKVFPIVVLGGLDSIGGAVVAAILIGVLESLAAGYMDPLLGAGFSGVAAYFLLIGMLFVRPHGLFGQGDVARV
jgi:branched-chain amino acid transport system permease protein